MVKVINPTDETGKNFTDPIEEAKTTSKTIFLAGPCPREHYEDDWRFQAIDYLNEFNFDGIIFNPTNPKYQKADPTYLSKQIKWEQDAMSVATKVLFWIPRDESHPAFTTNIELGHYLEKDRAAQFVIGMPDTAIKNDYIKVRLAMIDKEWDNDLKTLIKHTIDDLTTDNTKHKRYFLK